MTAECQDVEEEPMLKAGGFDDALIGAVEMWLPHPSGGHTQETVLAYSRSKVLAALMHRDGMSYDDAVEFFDFNIAGAYAGRRQPIFVEEMSMCEVCDIYADL